MTNSHLIRFCLAGLLGAVSMIVAMVQWLAWSNPGAALVTALGTALVAFILAPSPE